MTVNQRRIKYEILSNNLTQVQRHEIDCLDGEVVKETEKAVQIEWNTRCGVIRMWCPKSCIITDEQLRKEAEKEYHKFDRYTSILNKAIEMGVKGLRNKMKLETIYKKAKEQGFNL